MRVLVTVTQVTSVLYRNAGQLVGTLGVNLPVHVPVGADGPEHDVLGGVRQDLRVRVVVAERSQGVRPYA